MGKIVFWRSGCCSVSGLSDREQGLLDDLVDILRSRSQCQLAASFQMHGGCVGDSALMYAADCVGEEMMLYGIGDDGEINEYGKHLDDIISMIQKWRGLSRQ